MQRCIKKKYYFPKFKLLEILPHLTSEGILLDTHQFALVLLKFELNPTYLNLTLPLTLPDLGGHPTRFAFCTCLFSSITCPKFELNPSNLKFDMTFDLM